MSISVSVFVGSKVVAAPRGVPVRICTAPPPTIGTTGGLAIECSSRPQKKATAHHMKTRPKKTQPWDIRRRPTVYPPLPPLPPDFTIVGSAADESSDSGSPESPSAPPLEN